MAEPRTKMHENDWHPAPPPPLEEHSAHVWRVALNDEVRAEAFWPLLSPEEQERAGHRLRDDHRRRFVVAHGALRIILAGYVGSDPEALAFSVGKHGKPALDAERTAPNGAMEFNLSHSEDVALIAVARARPVGVDVQRWSERVSHLELAERFFSPQEREALRLLSHEPEMIEAGFFAAWTRKEAYLKATGHGITRGLHHFDVTLTPGERARLLADRLDRDATERWSMTELAPGPGYSGALVVESPLREVLRFAM
jgi:4'-phosphopantetheinyl transferase